MTKKITGFILTGLLAAPALAAVSTSASADPTPDLIDSPVRIRAIVSGRCLDVPGGPVYPANGTGVQQFDCLDGTYSNQEFELVRLGQTDQYSVVVRSSIVSGSPRQCLDVPTSSNGANGTALQVWTCQFDASSPQQLWTVNPFGTSYFFRNVSSNKCLDVRGGSSGTANGAAIQIWDCGSGWPLPENQLFDVYPAVDSPVLVPNTYRSSPSTVVQGRPVYNYAPTIMKDGKYRMWWCGDGGGDRIYYAESTSLDGPFTAHGSTAPHQVVFGPTGTSSFDGEHTCDPSVIRVGATYYMYYGGGDHATRSTRIGVASSPDGYTWTRLNGGQPIMTPKNPPHTGSSSPAPADYYGAGQPSVAYVDGYFYMMYTDKSAVATSNGTTWSYNGLQYAVRSTDPTFQTNVETATATGFAPLTAANKATFVVSGSYSPDWQFSDALQKWIVLSNQSPNYTRIRILSKDLSHQVGTDVTLPATLVEGPGLVSRPDKHSLPPANADCSRIQIDFVNATASSSTTTVLPTNLRHFGQDLYVDTPCAELPGSRVGELYEGYQVQATGMPPTFMTYGKRLQFGSFAPLQKLTRNVITTTPAVFAMIPYGASLHPGQTVYGASGRPPAFLLDDGRLWPTNSLSVVTSNGSAITTIPTAQFDTFPGGHPLYEIK